MKSTSFLIGFFLMLVMLPVLAAQEGSLSQDELRRALKERHKEALRLSSTLTAPENKATAARKMRPLWKLIVASQSPENPKILKDSQVARADALLQELQALKEQDTQQERRITQQQLRAQWAAEDVLAEAEKQTEELEAQRRRDETERIMQEVEEEQKSEALQEQEEREQSLKQPWVSPEEEKERKEREERAYEYFAQQIQTLRETAPEQERKELFGRGPASAQEITNLFRALPSDVADIVGRQSDITWLTPGLKVGTDILVTTMEGDGLEISNDSQFFLVQPSSDLIQMWSRDGILLHTYESSYYRPCISPDSQFIVISGDTETYLWDRSGKRIATLGGFVSGPLRVKISSNSKFIAAKVEGVVNEGVVNVWDRSGALLHTIGSPNTHSWGGINISPDSQFIVIDYDSYVTVWSVDGTLLSTLNGVTSPQITNDSRFIIAFASPGDDNSMQIWNREGDLLHRIKVDGHRSATISPDSQFIITQNLGMGTLINY